MKRIVLVLSSSLLLVFSFPNFDLGFLAWVGLLPLFIAIHGKSLRYSFLLSFACGIFFFAGIFYWILQIPGYKPLIHHTLLGVYLGPFFGFWGLALSFISRRWGVTPALFAAPFIWVSLEYIRSNFDFLSLPWALLAHSQYQYPVVIQIASITGAYGISFLIVLVNAALAAIVLSLSDTFQLGRKSFSKIPPNLPLLKGGERVEPLPKEGVITPPFKKGDRGGLQISRGIKALLLVTLSLIILTLLYGQLTLSTPITGNKVKISLVQGNIEQSKKWDPRFAREIMQIYTQLTQEVSKDHPAMIIWPETATPGSVTQIPMLYSQVKNIAKNAGTYLLLGSAQHQKFAPKGAKKPKYFNSAYLINPDPAGAKNQRYDKIRLFPFGEYLPYGEIIPWSLFKVSSLDSYTPGKEFTILKHPDFRFGVTICWESVFPDLVRQSVKRGAQCMINITNEARFGETAAPHQAASITVFRAVENRIFVVRCANTGVSCIIDPYGRIVDRIKDEKGQDIFIQGTLTGWIIPLDSKTLYTRYGDWLVWVALAGTLIFLFVPFFKKRE